MASIIWGYKGYFRQVEPPAVFQGFQIEFQQDIGGENAILYTSQNNHRFVVVKVLFVRLITYLIYPCLKCLHSLSAQIAEN